MSKRILVLGILTLSLTFFAGCVSTKPDTSGQTGPKAAPGSTKSGNSAQAAKPDTQATLLEEIMQLADQGKVVNCEFPVETTGMETVKEKWGEPDQEEYITAAKGRYATYSKHNTTLGINKGEQIFDVRSYDPGIKKLTPSKIQAVLGIPENIHHYATEDMLVYKAGEKYQLLFIFPKSTRQNPDPRLDHYNVFYPDGSVNSMADDPGLRY